MSTTGKALSVATAVALGLTGIGVAQAIPPGGAANTPGTEVVITNASQKAGRGTVTVFVTGFPTNAAKYGVKIDDGRGYSNTHVHGQGNLVSDPVFSGDTIKFVISIPCSLDQSIENHWVRVLAQGPDGRRYSSKSVNTFKVTDFTHCPA